MSKESIMTVAFRVDASLDIGTGHVMRCITLAEALREHGAECHFVCREHTGHLFDLIRQRGFPVSALPPCDPEELKAEEKDKAPQPVHANWLACDWVTDARQAGEILTELKPDWLVLDHYALDSRWEVALQGLFGKLMVIDDLADRAHVCDLLLDQNLGRKVDDYTQLVPGHCSVLTGPQYALLRPEFAALREYSLKRRVSSSLKHLMITMGGVDQPNATGQVLEALKDSPLPTDCRITVVMGSQAPWLSQVRDIALSMPWPTNVRVNITDMAHVMAESDLAIGAAGSTSWERCCLGLPTLLVVLADNQLSIAEALVASGAAVLLGNISEKHFSTCLSEAITEFIGDAGALRTMSTTAARMVDGGGAEDLTRFMRSQ